MFNKNNFCHIASNNRNEKKAGVFVYKTTDDLATVLTSGYFNDKIVDINLHDLIIHEWHDQADRTKVQRNVLCVTERTLDNVGTTLIKSKWEEDIESAVETIQDDIETIQDDITDIKAKDIEQDGRLDDIEEKVAYKATDFATPITTTNKGITQTEETALNSKIDLAANSGRMITAQGVWYAKMYAATVAPAADDDTNYADFSQTDGQGNPIIVTYTRTNGAWVQDQTITPPADYDGYVPITSKIWDIPEQAGQQGGRILWNHQSKEFTPYPQIISFKDASLTGTSTVEIPQNPSTDQIVNKGYVDSEIQQAITESSDFDIFDTKWRDATTNNTRWLLSDGNWKTNTRGYQHLAADYNALVTSKQRLNVPGHTLFRNESLDVLVESHPYAYSTEDQTTFVAYTDVLAEPGVSLSAYDGPTSSASSMSANPIGPYSMAFYNNETIAGTTITYYLAADGHKICLPDQETNANSIYAATGIAWYYILDTANQQFKLPRTQHAFVGLRDIVGAYVSPGLPDHNHNIQVSINVSAGTGYQKYLPGSGTTLTTTGASASNPIYGNSTTVQPPATQMHLYFYVGV